MLLWLQTADRVRFEVLVKLLFATYRLFTKLVFREMLSLNVMLQTASVISEPFKLEKFSLKKTISFGTIFPSSELVTV